MPRITYQRTRLRQRNVTWTPEIPEGCDLARGGSGKFIACSRCGMVGAAPAREMLITPVGLSSSPVLGVKRKIIFRRRPMATARGEGSRFGFCTTIFFPVRLRGGKRIRRREELLRSSPEARAVRDGARGRAGERVLVSRIRLWATKVWWASSSRTQRIGVFPIVPVAVAVQRVAVLHLKQLMTWGCFRLLSFLRTWWQGELVLSRC